MKSFDLVPDVVSGVATATTSGIELVEKLTGVKALSLYERDGLNQVLEILKRKFGF